MQSSFLGKREYAAVCFDSAGYYWQLIRGHQDFGKGAMWQYALVLLDTIGVYLAVNNACEKVGVRQLVPVPQGMMGGMGPMGNLAELNYSCARANAEHCSDCSVFMFGVHN